VEPFLEEVSPVQPVIHRSNRWTSEAEGSLLPRSLTGPTGEVPVQPVAPVAEPRLFGLEPHRSNRCATGPTGGTFGRTSAVRAQAPSVRPVRTGPTGGAL